ncbi:hypothetical protein ACIQXM_17410 [Arthrobacter sp. NPDC097144]|uniref:hypothetical protein n=1 Tax=Arthrobacter sp. NPDC097144 TaxID=3363946 RepID=UPI00380DF306
MVAITAVAIGALAAGPAAANAVTHSSPDSQIYATAAPATAAAPDAAQPHIFGAAVNVGRAMYSGFKAGTAPREVGRVLGWGSFLASSPVEDTKSFNQDQAFDR